MLIPSSLEMDDTKSSHLIMMDGHSSLLGKMSHLPHKVPPSRLLDEKEGSLLSNLTTGFNGVWKEGAPGVQHHVDSEAVSEFSFVPVLPVKTTSLSLSLFIYKYTHIYIYLLFKYSFGYI